MASRWLLLALLSALSLQALSCGAGPKIIEREPPPQGSVDVTPFLKAGCVRDGHRLDCTFAPKIRALGCSFDLWIDESLAGLNPKLPIAECGEAQNVKGPRATEGIRKVGCLFQTYLRYVYWKDGAFALIENEPAFRRVFAPVDTPTEALAFATVVTGAAPMYDLDLPDRYRFLVSQAETSYVEADGDAFRAHLFMRDQCGCGHHPTYAVDQRVDRDGRVSEMKRAKVFEEKVEVCVD